MPWEGAVAIAKHMKKNEVKSKPRKAAAKASSRAKTKTARNAARKSTAKPANKPASRTAKAAEQRWPRQLFIVSHLREDAFDHGLRPYSAYRDLGIAGATGGKVQAHVIRMTKPFDPDKVSIPHAHDVEFQMIYVLKGWFSTQFEGHGTHTFRAGSCWIQPPRIKHTVMGYSDDCELLEVISPAQFETVEFKS
jgi:quercetin dioxygenase-like cupin family protein